MTNKLDADLLDFGTEEGLDQTVNLDETLRPDLFGDDDADEEQDPILIDKANDIAESLETLHREQIHFPKEDAAHGNEEKAEAIPEPEGPQQGNYKDVFASESEDEDQQIRAGEWQKHETGSGDEGHLEYVSEAEEEEDEFEAMFKAGKKRWKKDSHPQEIVATVETLIANMEVAAEVDLTANEEGKPAVNKIKILPEVEEKLSQSNLHRELLDGGILGALKLWIEVLPNGSLPNVKVRTAVLKMLHKLPIDLSLEGRKEQLKKSELGRYVMFYSKLPDETLPNRQLARSLIEKWSRPIFDQYRERGDEEELREREANLTQLRKRRRQQLEQAVPKSEPAKNLKPGDPGFRWHASIPAPARLDYMKRPESRQTVEGEAVKGRAKPKDRMSKKLAALSRKGSRKSSEGKLSLQGKGLLT